MKKFVLILLAVLFVIGLAFNSNAAEKEKSSAPHRVMQKHDGGCGCDSSHSPMGMFKKLGLDEKQMKSVREIHFRTMKEMVKKKADLKVAKIELQEILSKDPVDMAAAETAVKKAESLKSEMKMMHIKAMEEVKSNLTDEQKKKFMSMIQHKMMHHEMMEHGKCNMHGKSPMEDKEDMKGEMKHEQHHH
jgi:Spy/CpxP family protein refolding chaperone